MKHLHQYTLTAIVLFLLFTSFDRNDHSYDNSENGTIEVTGSADMEVIPNQYHFQINIGNYYSKTNTKEFEKIEANFQDALEKAGISKDQVKLSANSAYTHYYYYSYWRNKDYHHRSKVYIVTMDELSQIETFFKHMEIAGIHSIHTLPFTNTEIQEYREQVKIEALKAAERKAAYMLASVNKKVGTVISIKEITDNNSNKNPYYGYWGYYGGQQQNTLSNVSVASPQAQSQSGDNNEETSKAIKLRYEVNVVYQIR